MKMRKILCLLLSLVMLLSLAACGDEGSGSKGKKPEAVAEAFMEAFIDADAGAMFDLVPSDVIDAMLEEADLSKSEWNDYMDDLSDELEALYEETEENYDGKLKITYDIADAEDLDDEDLEDIQEMYEELDIEVKDAKYIEIEATMECGDYSEDTTMEVIVIKVGSSWYVEVDSLDSVF